MAKPIIIVRPPEPDPALMKRVEAETSHWIATAGKNPYLAREKALRKHLPFPPKP